MLSYHPREPRSTSGGRNGNQQIAPPQLGWHMEIAECRSVFDIYQNTGGPGGLHQCHRLSLANPGHEQNSNSRKSSRRIFGNDFWRRDSCLLQQSKAALQPGATAGHSDRNARYVNDYRQQQPLRDS